MRSTLTENEILKSLIDNNYLTEDIAQNALESYQKGTVVDNLIAKKIVNKDIIGQSIAETEKLKYFDLNSIGLDPQGYNLLPSNVVLENRILVFKVESKKLYITTDNVRKLEEIETTLKNLIPNIAFEFFYSLSEDIDEVLIKFKDPFQNRIDAIFETGIDFTNKFIEELFNEALELRASDIHFEPQPERILLKVRIDGLLQEIAVVPPTIYENILNKVKVMSNIRIDQRFKTQDGAIKYKNDKFEVDMRVSIIPIIDGQKIVIRILSDYTKDLNIRDLGLSEKNALTLEKAYNKTVGMILTTGPTGSGKTTTLYSIIKILLRPEVNITTIEDPVEYRIPGINQIQVNAENDITFAKGLRSMVRQDPNVMLVGEIRDSETAEIAVNAALTGHLLLSTFHANDAATAIPRLIDMGIETFLLASTLNLILAQRLTRRICNSCRVSQEYTHKQLEELFPYSRDYFTTEKIRLYKGKGCQKCNGTGYKGRIGIFELIEVNDDIRDLIMSKANSREIWSAAQTNGSVSFFDDGMDKVKAGLTTIEEVLRVAPPPAEKKAIYKNIRKLGLK